MSNNDLIEPRRDYAAQTLRRAELTQNPTEQFKLWLQQARDAQLIDATAMVLATADSAGQPHARIVLLKQVDDAGFVWFTYKDSDKGQQIAANPQASILFYWRELERQVRVEGSVTDIANTSADDYFYSRPEGSRFSAAVSLQSAPVHDRSVLEQGVAALHSQHPDGNVPRPERWGGYRLNPVRFEFWQGRPDRLHDRFIYTCNATEPDNNWTITRLQP